MGGVEHPAGGGLLDEPIEDIVNNVLKIGEKAVNHISGWRFVESVVVPDEAVLEFSCHCACIVDVLVIAAEKAAKEIRWLVYSCSPPQTGGEHVVLQEKLELKTVEQRYCLGSCRIQKVVYRRYVLQGVGTAGHSFQTLRSPLGGFL
jgi:hypothetical protein